MTAFETSAAMIAVMDVLAIAALSTMVLCFLHGHPDTTTRVTASIAGNVLALWGALWTWFPPLAAWRLGPSITGAPSAVPTLGLIIGASAVLTSLALSTLGQRQFTVIDPRRFLALGPWRAVFGMGLLATGISGGLPSGFFWSAAIGDIVVGVLGMVLLIRGTALSESLWRTWNIVGLADLMHVVALAAVFVPPFFAANPRAPTLNLVPLIIVPAFVALHAGALSASLSRRGPIAVVPIAA